MPKRIETARSYMAKLKKIYDLISSMNTGLVLLALIGLSAAGGWGFGPDKFFASSLFRLLLLALFANMTLCTLKQLWRYRKVLRSGRMRGGTRIRLVGLLLLHAGMVIILIGGALNGYRGEKAEIRIVEGRTVDVARAISTPSPFWLKLERFKITYNPDGSPSQYYSTVSVLDKDGSKLKSTTVSVNHPMKYRKVKVYQQSFGYLVRVRCENGSSITRKEMNIGEMLAVPGSERKAKLYRYVPNFDPAYGMESKTMRPDNPRIIFSVYQGDRLLGVGAAPFGERVKIDEGVYVIFEGLTPFTVLTVKTDPGLPLTAAGGLMLMGGVCLAVLGAGQRKTNEVPREE